MNNNKFGIEFEFLVPEDYETYEVRALFKFHSKKFNLKFSRHYTGKTWNIHDDFSIKPEHRGLEIGSPILSGKKGLDEVKRFVELLHYLGCSVNKTCGLHVHVNSKNNSSLEKLAVLSAYHHNQKYLNKFFAKHRQNSNNRYIGNLYVDNLRDEIHNALECDEDGIYTEKYSNIRIHEDLPTIEFRQHEGTLNIKKILKWIEFCLDFHEVSIGTYKYLAHKQNKNVANHNNKKEVIEKILLKELNEYDIMGRCLKQKRRKTA